jgi:hypothetical protein
MSKDQTSGLQIVTVSDPAGKNTKWVAAVAREHAVEAVLRFVPEGSSAVLSSQRLSLLQVSALKLQSGEVVEWK